MSKLKERLEEMERITKKNRFRNNLLWAGVALSVLLAIGFGIWAGFEKERADTAKKEALAAQVVAEDARKQIAKNDSITQIKLDSLVHYFVQDAWQQAKSINTLQAYSTYASSQEEGTNADSLDLAIKNLLNTIGFVQIVEKNGNELFNSVDLDLEGEFISMKKSVNARDGQWGAQGYEKVVGVVPEGQVVKIKKRYPSESSDSEWAEITFKN